MLTRGKISELSRMRPLARPKKEIIFRILALETGFLKRHVCKFEHFRCVLRSTKKNIVNIVRVFTQTKFLSRVFIRLFRLFRFLSVVCTQAFHVVASFKEAVAREQATQEEIISYHWWEFRRHRDTMYILKAG